MEHLDVLVVGAGLSGIDAAHHLQTHCPWADYAILEARGALGGTWDLFRYPGIRSDSDMFTLGYSFKPWKGDKAIADGPSILAYLTETAAESGIDDKIRYHHRVVTAEWSSEDARWTVTIDRLDPEAPDDPSRTERVELTCSFLFTCTGYYRYDQGYLPEFEGVDRYGGTTVHPQHWPADLEVAGKRVVVIGSGATAVTLVPSLAAEGAQVTMLQRSPTWILSMPERNPVVDQMRRRLPERLWGPAVRWMLALGAQGFYQLSQRRPELVKGALLRRLRAMLPAGYDVDTHFTPSYDPWDQRVCLVPDGDLFRAIRNGTVDVVTDRIRTFTEAGVELESGTELSADIVVTATGLELLFLGGMDLLVDGEKVEVADKLTYKGMMLDDVPNMAFCIGYTNASWTLRADLTCEYVSRLLNHMRMAGMRQCTPVNDDAAVDTQPLLGLTSGYVQRALDRIPQQGSRFPWQVKQSYLADHRALRRSEVDDGVMRFTNRRHPSA